MPRVAERIDRDSLWRKLMVRMISTNLPVRDVQKRLPDMLARTDVDKPIVTRKLALSLIRMARRHLPAGECEELLEVRESISALEKGRVQAVELPIGGNAKPGYQVYLDDIPVGPEVTKNDALTIVHWLAEAIDDITT